MTKYSRQKASEQFVKHGYNKTCYFISVANGRFKARCKVCGYEFERDTNILRKPQKKLSCPNCRNLLVTAALEYYQDGHSRYECAERFGLTPIQVQNYAKSRGVHGGMSKEECGMYARAAQKKACEASAKASRERGRLSRNDKRIRKEWRDLNDSLAQWHKTIEIIDSEASRNARAFKSLNDWINRQYSWCKDSLVEHEPKIATCKHCGKEWLFWPSHEKYGRRNPSTFCSDKCLNRYYKTGTINERLRRRGRAGEHRDVIPLDAVIERDNGICYLCGCKTSKEDSWHDVNGYFVCGDTYPTRDHVIPIAKGGTHTWDNVRLACRKCNSDKNDKLLEECALEQG